MSYEDVVKLALERGFFFPSAEIYSDAPAGFWDYGPLGVLFKRRLIELWRREIVRKDGMLEIDGAVILPESVFKASGHIDSFVDPLVECTDCGLMHRADRLIQAKTGKIVPERLSESEFDGLLAEHGIKCPKCGGELSRTRKFNMMFRVGVGPESRTTSYIRPETCQSIFVGFNRLVRVTRSKLPVGIAQVGRSFRNEISPRQSLIRLRELIQAEVEVFFDPRKADDFGKFKDVEQYSLRLMPSGLEEVLRVTCGEALEQGLVSNKLVVYYLAILQQFYERTGIDMQLTRLRQMAEDEKPFYAKEGWDFEVETSVGWLELVACHYRTDYDLKGHSGESGRDLSVFEGGKVIPHVFELSMGIDRTLYSILEHAFTKHDERDLLRLPSYLAPLQAAVFPLVSRDGLPEKAREVHQMLKMDFDVFYDESGSIGRRYRRQDEVGTPFCITIDYVTLQDNTVTVRDRDTMRQDRVETAELPAFLRRGIRLGPDSL